MAIAHIARTSGGDTASTSSVATTSGDFTGANLIDVAVQWNAGGVTVSGVADTAGNVYSAFGSVLTVGANSTQHWRAFNITGASGQTHTATLSGPAIYRAIVAHGFSGIESASSPNDENKTASGTSAAISSGSFTLAVSEEVIVLFCEADADSIANATYTITNFAITGDATKYFADGYHIVTANEAATATCASGGWYANAVSYKSATGGGGGRGLFRVPSLSGVGVGGSFFRDPLQAREQMVRKGDLYVPERLAA